MTADPLAWVRAEMDAAEKEAEAARDDAGDADWYAHEAGVHTKTAGRQILVGPWDYLDAALGAHMARHDPAAALRRIKAERKVLDEHPQHGIDPECARCVTWDEDDEGDLVATPKSYPCATVRLIAEGWGWTEET